MKNTEVFYHGSLNEEIHRFHPFSHFGSRIAAAEAAYRHAHYDEKGSLTLYEVTIDLEEETTIELEDCGTPNPIGMALALRKHFEGQISKEFEEIRNSMVEKKMSHEEYRNYGISLIQEKLI